jgi:F-type H+-transporting ATPase subunit a
MSNSLDKFNIVASPLDQFEIKNLISLDLNILGNIQISLTNIGLYLTISAILVLSLNLLATNYNKIVANE